MLNLNLRLPPGQEHLAAAELLAVTTEAEWAQATAFAVAVLLLAEAVSMEVAAVSIRAGAGPVSAEAARRGVSARRLVLAD